MAGPLDTAFANVHLAPLGVKGLLHSATLTGTLALDLTYPNLLKLDPGGSARDVTLPPAADFSGGVYAIVNAADAAETITLKEHADDGGSTVGTIEQNRAVLVAVESGAWVFVAKVTISLS